MIAVLMVAIGCLAVFLTRRPPVARYRPFATEGARECTAAWSPGGQSLAYVQSIHGVQQIVVRALDSPASQQVTHSTEACREPFWSPDGSRIFYSMRSALWSTALAGGEPRKELDAAGDAGLSPGSRTPLDRLPRGSELKAALQALDEQAATLARAVEINRGRDAELDLLGPRRILWGSDVPGLLGQGTYPQLLRWAEAALGGLTDQERASVLGGNAREVFSI